MLKALPIVVAWLLLWSAPFLPASTHGHHAVLARLKAAGAPSYTVYASADFEETGTPGGGWGVDNSADPDYTTAPAPLSGLESGECPTATDRFNSPDFGDQDEVWVYFIFRPGTVDTVNTTNVQGRLNGGNANVNITHRSDGVLRISPGASGSTDSVSSYTNTVVYLKLHFVSASAVPGNDGSMTLVIDDDGDFSGGTQETVSFANHNDDQQIDQWRWQGGGNGSILVDDILITDGDPGDTPTLP